MTAVQLTMLINNSPAPSSVLDALHELTVETSVDSAGSFRLRLGIAPGDSGSWPLLDPALFRPRADFLLRVHGQSMREADIHDRDILAVHRTAQASNGQIVVARLGDEATVKYYHRKGHLLRLEPANAAFQPIHVDLRREPCFIEGLVVGLVRSDLPRAR